ncbi:MAG: AAA family ATPase [Candidatus Limnocylindria bacterium]
MAVEITLLGPPSVRRGGEQVRFDTRKAVALLAHLALTDGPRSRDAVCELLWPGHEPDRARGALRRTLSTLRSGIGKECLDTPGDAIVLREAAGLDLDVARFRALAASETSPDSLTEAVGLYAGEFLEGFALRDSPEFDHWQMGQADLLRRELSSALRRLVKACSERGEHERALAYAERWVTVEPLHEPAHRELIRLYARTDDRGAALHQYRQCVRVLSQELGVAPLDETTALFEQVSEGTLPPSPAPEPVPSSSGAPRVPLGLPLVGRAAQLDALMLAHHSARESGGVVVVEGEAGIGKSRLCDELVAAARKTGATVLEARCHEEEAGLPYAPVVELLRGAAQTAERWEPSVAAQRLADASLLLPELASLRVSLPEPRSLELPGAQVRLMDAVVAVLEAATAGPVAGVLLLDDVHAADEATLDLLAYLARRLSRRRLLLVLSWRTEAVPPGHSLRRLAAGRAAADTDPAPRLDRFDEAQVAELVRAASPAPSRELEQRVFRESEGLPLFVAEYVVALRAGAGIEPDAVPSRVRGLVASRLTALDAVAAQVLSAAAAIGRSIDFDTAMAASGRTEDETVDALDQLVAQGLLRGGEPTYTFSHQKLRELVYEETSPARRRLLHRRIAASMRRSGDTAAFVALHLRLSGQSREAAEQYRSAAEHAASLLAHADALIHLEMALALEPPDAPALHERIGDLRTLVGEYAAALASYERAAAESEGWALGALEQKLSGVHARRGEWDRSEARLATALGALPPQASGLRARIVADLALTLHQAGRHAEAAARAVEARDLAEAAADPRALAQAHNMLGILARTSGKVDEARGDLSRSLELAEDLGEPPALVAALNNLALVERNADDFDRALQLTERALELCAGYGDRHREAALENNLADLHHAMGHEEETMAHLKRAVAMFASLEADEATRLPEIWKLVSW